MRKIQITIAIYIIVVLIMSIFFMPMNTTLISTEQLSLDTVTYKPIWDTELNKDGEVASYYTMDISVYKLYLTTLTLVTLSVVAIQALQIIKTQPLQPNVKE